MRVDIPRSIESRTEYRGGTTMAAFLFRHACKIISSTKLLKNIQLNVVNPNVGDSIILNLHHGMVLFLHRYADI